MEIPYLRPIEVMPTLLAALPVADADLFPAMARLNTAARDKRDAARSRLASANARHQQAIMARLISAAPGGKEG